MKTTFITDINKIKFEVNTEVGFCRRIGRESQ